MLQQLIATPSMSSVNPSFDTSNLAVIELLESWLTRLGFKVEISTLPNQPNKANLLASYGDVYPESQGLMLAGHTDTVPYDEHSWQYDPFSLTEKEGRFYGLGSTDMKGFFALAIEAVAQFSASELKQPVFILATADEESSMDGAAHLVQQGCPHVRHAIIGEPTNLRPISAHKGIMMEGIRIKGKSGHSSNPAHGESALEAMQLVMAELLQWRSELQQKHHDRRFAVPVPTLNLGHIRGGDNPNRICEQSELHFDLRPIPGMEPERLRMQLRDRLHQLFKNSAIQWELFSLSRSTPAMHTPDESLIVKHASHCCGHHSETAAFCTEGPYLTQLGIETIILGPGDINLAHQPNEYIPLDSIKPTVEILTKMIQKFCL